jgi:hypothetical protein
MEKRCEKEKMKVDGYTEGKEMASSWCLALEESHKDHVAVALRMCHLNLDGFRFVVLVTGPAAELVVELRAPRQIWSPDVKEGLRLRLFENAGLRRICVPARDEVSGRMETREDSCQCFTILL